MAPENPSRTLEILHTKVVDKDGEKIGATLLDSRQTPAEVQRRQTAKTAIFRATIFKQINVTGICLQDRMTDDAHQTTRRKRHYRNVERTHLKSIPKIK